MQQEVRKASAAMEWVQGNNLRLKLDFPTNGSINHLEEKYRNGLRSSHPCTELKM